MEPCNNLPSTHFTADYWGKEGISVRKPFSLFASMLIIMAALLLSGCADSTPQTPAYSVIPELEPLYSRLGGAALLGPAISAEIYKPDGMKYQYFSAAVLQYDPRSGVAALRNLDASLMPSEAPNGEALEGGMLIGEYWAPPTIAALYTWLGPENVGQPISNYNYDAGNRRYEMYFQKLGFYVLDGDETQAVRLLPYGRWGLAIEPDTGAGFKETGPNNPNAKQALDQAQTRLGTEITGALLVQEVLDGNGNPLRIFEAVVMRFDIAKNSGVEFLPLPAMLGIGEGPLVPEIKDSRFIFQPIDGELGHNIPVDFFNLISAHGGLEVSGLPISEIFYTGDNKFVRQCFEHLCLDWSRVDQQIVLVPLGRRYYSEVYRPAPTTQPLSVLSMKVWESTPRIVPGQAQEINVYVSRDNIPQAGVTPTLKITLPDGQVYVYPMPATREDGQSFLLLPALEAGNGSLINYEICLPNKSFCVGDSYLVWEN